MEVILASQSPRRRELMAHFPFPFSVQVSCAEEEMDPKKAPQAEVARVSRAKAEAIPRGQDDLVIGADTIVVCDGQVLGKPKDEADALRMLSLLSGKRHQVMTGVTVLQGTRSRVFTEITDIYFRPLTEAELLSYIRTGEPMDKAGAYGIQGRAGLFVEKIVGDYYNVVGLPICKLSQVLKEMAPELMEERV